MLAPYFLKVKLFSTSVSDKRRIKAFEQPSSPVQEEPEPVSYVLQGDDIQALAIKLEALEKVGIKIKQDIDAYSARSCLLGSW